MARSQQEIEQLIQTQKEAESSLGGITSTSRLGIWVTIRRVVAFAHRQLEVLWDAMKLELELAAASAASGTVAWYAQKVGLWQYDYGLTEVNGQLVYLVIDEDSRLAQKVAVVVSGKTLLVKVAKDSSGTLVPLTDPEKVSLDSYVRAIKFAGTQHLIVSTLADEVSITANVYYDGKLDLTALTTTFQNAIEAYLRGIQFDGVLNKNRLRDAGEIVPGIIDFDLTLLQARPNGGTYTTVTREYNPVSGYYTVQAYNLSFIPQ
jgi:hypothetical protein